MDPRFRSKWCPVVVLAVVASALLAPDTLSMQGKAEDDVKAAFVALQAAIKAKDAGKTWELLDNATKADAERSAKIITAGYKKANDKDKADQRQKLGLTADEIAKVDGKTLLNTKPFFLSKYGELPGSKITSVTITGESATLNYVEEDGDKEKMTYTRQDGKWKAALKMPNFAK